MRTVPRGEQTSTEIHPSAEWSCEARSLDNGSRLHVCEGKRGGRLYMTRPGLLERSCSSCRHGVASSVEEVVEEEDGVKDGGERKRLCRGNGEVRWASRSEYEAKMNASGDNNGVFSSGSFTRKQRHSTSLHLVPFTTDDPQTAIQHLRHRALPQQHAFC